MGDPPPTANMPCHLRYTLDEGGFLRLFSCVFSTFLAFVDCTPYLTGVRRWDRRCGCGWSFWLLGVGGPVQTTGKRPRPHPIAAGSHVNATICCTPIFGCSVGSILIW
jgi:hypothetical protein